MRRSARIEPDDVGDHQRDARSLQAESACPARRQRERRVDHRADVRTSIIIFLELRQRITYSCIFFSEQGIIEVMPETEVHLTLLASGLSDIKEVISIIIKI